MEEKSGPLKTIRFGGVEVSVWENTSPIGKQYKCTVRENYKKKDGSFGSSQSVSVQKLPQLKEALSLAIRWQLDNDETSKR